LLFGWLSHAPLLCLGGLNHDLRGSVLVIFRSLVERRFFFSFGYRKCLAVPELIVFIIFFILIKELIFHYVYGFMPLILVPLVLILKSLVCSDLSDVILGGAGSWNRFNALIDHRQRGPIDGALPQQRGGRLVAHLLEDVYLVLLAAFWAVPI
jgi:hypothetical protein